jgi:hypothetical protein
MSEFIICGDINISYINESSQRKQVNFLPKTYNLSYTVNFARGVQNSSSRAIEIIFIDSASLSSSCTSPIVNGLSDNDAQFLTANISSEVNSAPLKQKTRKMNNETIAPFQHLLENEIWEPVFKNKDTNY